MINKFRPQSKISNNLFEIPDSIFSRLGNATTFFRTLSTNPIWKVLIEHKYFYLKIQNLSGNEERFLELEYRILSTLYTDLEITFFDNHEFAFLLVPELSQNKCLNYGQLFAYLDTLIPNIDNASSFVPRQRSFLVLLEQAELALDLFSSQKLIQSHWIDDLSEAIRALREHHIQSRKIICHGDVSSRNIYNFHGSLILLDWEDCFWGYDGFDYVYWLTFINNMDQLSQSSIERIPIEVRLIRASYLLIVLLKEFLHFNNYEAKSRMTLETRLALFDSRIPNKYSL